MPPHLGWKSAYNEKVYSADNPTLVGLGTPPGCPDYCRQNPGAGQMAMEAVMIPDPDLPAAQAESPDYALGK